MIILRTNPKKMHLQTKKKVQLKNQNKSVDNNCLVLLTVFKTSQLGLLKTMPEIQD